MSITVNEAAEIARRAGLSLPDAQALSVLADDVEHAKQLAAQFAPETVEPDDLAPDVLADQVFQRSRGY